MDCETIGSLTIIGNFAPLLDHKPEKLDYDKTAKWIEPYSCEWREVMGDAICSCATVEVHYAPYYGFDHYHRPTCSLMRKLKAQPGINNLREVHLPAMVQWNDSIPNDGKLHIWVERKNSRPKKIKVKIMLKQLSLVEGLL